MDFLQGDREQVGTPRGMKRPMKNNHKVSKLETTEAIRKKLEANGVGLASNNGCLPIFDISMSLGR